MIFGSLALTQLWNPLSEWLLESTRQSYAAPIAQMDVLETRFMTDIVITAAKRTPVGSFLGAFAATPAHELGRVAIEAAMAQAGITGEHVSAVILGHLLPASQGHNPATQPAMAAGPPPQLTPWSS